MTAPIVPLIELEREPFGKLLERVLGIPTPTTDEVVKEGNQHIESQRLVEKTVYERVEQIQNTYRMVDQIKNNYNS